MKTKEEVEIVLDDILNEYEILLRYYENIYNFFKDINFKDLNEYTKTLLNVSNLLESASESQQKIDKLRNGLKEDINDDLLIDYMLDGYSKGRFKIINDKIVSIISLLISIGENTKSVLEHEMENIQNKLEDVGISRQYIKFYSLLSTLSENICKN